MGHDAKIQIEQGSGHNNSDYEPFPPVVKLALVIIPIYPIRQIVFWSFKLFLKVFKDTAHFLDFEFDYVLEDKPKWCWFQNLELPKYWVKRLD